MRSNVKCSAQYHDVHLCGAQKKQICTAYGAAMRLLASAHDIELAPHVRPGYVVARAQCDGAVVVAEIWVPDIPALFGKKAFEDVIELRVWDGHEITLDVSTYEGRLFVKTFIPGTWEQVLVQESKKKKPRPNQPAAGQQQLSQERRAAA